MFILEDLTVRLRWYFRDFSKNKTTPIFTKEDFQRSLLKNDLNGRLPGSLLADDFCGSLLRKCLKTFIFSKTIKIFYYFLVNSCILIDIGAPE